MKIYLVMSGEYSGTITHWAHTSKTKAEVMAARIYKGWVKELDLDPEPADEFLTKKIWWSARFGWHDNSLLEVCPHWDQDEHEYKGGEAVVRETKVYWKVGKYREVEFVAIDQETARRYASDLLAQWLAQPGREEVEKAWRDDGVSL